jgi:Protein of unknown function (DUF4233)
MRMAARIVLVGELFVVLFAGLVARAQTDVGGWTVLAVCLVVVALCIIAMGTLSRGSVGFVLGSVVQVGLLASTFWIHLMGVVGVVFATLWGIALVQGKRADEMRAFAIESAERLRELDEPPSDPPPGG